MPIRQVFGHFYWLRRLSENAETHCPQYSTHSIGPHMRIRNAARGEEMKNVIKKVFFGQVFCHELRGFISGNERGKWHGRISVASEQA